MLLYCPLRRSVSYISYIPHSGTHSPPLAPRSSPPQTGHCTRDDWLADKACLSPGAAAPVNVDPQTQSSSDGLLRAPSVLTAAQPRYFVYPQRPGQESSGSGSVVRTVRPPRTSKRQTGRVTDDPLSDPWLAAAFFFFLTQTIYWLGSSIFVFTGARSPLDLPGHQPRHRCD